MITDLEMVGGEPEGEPAPADVVGTDRGGHGRRPGWPWVLGSAVATSALWAATLHGIGYGHTAPPDLHGYRLAESPCSGDNLKPLTDAFGPIHFSASTAVMPTGATLDQAQCNLIAEGPIDAHWTASFDVTVTVDLHKKADPAPEFLDANRTGGPNLGEAGVMQSDESVHVEEVPGLGDKAFLLTGDPDDQALTVLYGGVVLTVDLSVLEQGAGSGGPPVNADGYPAQPPGLTRYHPALTAAVRRLMSALAA